MSSIKQAVIDTGGLEKDEVRKQYPRFDIQLLVAVSAIYILLRLINWSISPPGNGGHSHFIYLADGWLHGQFSVAHTPPDFGDYTYYNGHWYVAFPPLPAILLLPFVAIFHLAYQELISASFTLIMGLINIWLMAWVLNRFVRLLSVQMAPVLVAWLLPTFALGTEHLYVSMQGAGWFSAHIVATTFLLLFIGETLGRQRGWLAAIFLGLAMLSRATTILAFPFFLLLLWRMEYRRPALLGRQLAAFCAVLSLFILGLLLYNLVRFGSPLDFGYSAMQVDPLLRDGLQKYGQFHMHFLPTNLHFMLLQPPRLISTFPYLTFNPFGTGIFWTMPVLLCAFLAFQHAKQRWLAFLLLAACFLPALAIALYFNTGWYQFGYRFVMDFLPFLFLLAILGMGTRLTWPKKLLIGLSIPLNLWGYLVFAYFRPPLL